MKTPDEVGKPESNRESSQKRVLLLVGLYSFCFLAATFPQASKPVWMDEVLAVWVARFHSARTVVSALYCSEFAPPTHDLILRALMAVTSAFPAVIYVFAVFFIGTLILNIA